MHKTQAEGEAPERSGLRTHRVAFLAGVTAIFLLVAMLIAASPVIGSVSSQHLVGQATRFTAEPGLVITGHVRLNGSTGPGLGDATIFRGYAGYPGDAVASTDVDGYYDTGYSYIPGDEMVAVWAARAGYSINPPEYYWRHYFGYEKRTMDFFARPLVTNCTVPPIPHRMLVYGGSPDTSSLSYTVYIYLGRNGPWTTPATITVTSEAGTVTQTGYLRSSTPMIITTPLLPDTVHHVSVLGEFTEADGCYYVTFSAFDERGYAFIIHQQLLRFFLPLVTRDG